MTTTERKQWTTEDVVNLIEAYRTQANLWNPKNPNYKDRIKKRDAYKEIASIFDTTVTEIERKIKNIISQYQRERRAYKNMKKSGAGHVFKSKWFGYKALSFLHDKNKPRREETQIDVKIEEEMSQSDSQFYTHSTNEFENDRSAIEPHLVVEEGNSTINNSGNSCDEFIATAMNSTKQTQEGTKITTQLSHEKRMLDTPKTTSTKFSEDKDGDETAKFLKIMKTVYERAENQERRDEYDTFLEMVAHNLRSLNTEHAKVTLQYYINKLLYEARLGKYDYPETTSQFTPRSSNSISSELGATART